MGTPATSSVIGNMVSQRQKIAAIRQRVGLEEGPQANNGPMRSANGPTPSAPAYKLGAEAEAVQNNPGQLMRNPNLPTFTGDQVGKHDQLTQMMGQHLQQALAAGVSKFSDPKMQAGEMGAEMEGAQGFANGQEVAPEWSDSQLGKAAGQMGQKLKGDLVRGLAPMADFFKSNGRLPNMDELQMLSAKRQLQAQLGREPTDIEAQLYVSKPPKTGGR